MSTTWAAIVIVAAAALTTISVACLLLARQLYRGAMGLSPDADTGQDPDDTVILPARDLTPLLSSHS